MKLSDWAKQQGISYLTAWRWHKTGKMPVPTYVTPSGSIIVQPEIKNPIDSCVIYARVSSYEKKEDLDRQATRCEDFCRANGWVVESVVKEVGSGMNDSRRKLSRILSTPPSRLVVENKDRLTRFGFNYFEVLLPQLGCQLIVINRDVEERDDLMKDLIAIITSFCCRLYGKRRGSKKAKETVRCAEQ